MTYSNDSSQDDGVQTQRAPEGRDAPEPRLLVAFWDGGTVTVRLPTRGTLIIGRGAEADVRIDHPTISRRHAAFVVEDSRFSLADLDSTNGTFIDGRRAEAHVPATVDARTPMRLGWVRLKLEEPPSPSVEVPDPRTSTIAPRPSEKSEMSRVLSLIDLAAQTSMTVVLLGETGVGKEGLATRVHQRSPRASAPLLKVNCAALVESLLEAELFGHERGAFTGAVQAKEGLLESASGGTLFLDELGEMPLTTQAKLLRVLESGEVVRVGGVRPRRIDVRFVAATNRDLRELVALGKFREDLFFRLDGVSIHVPPLRARRDEILGLARLFAEQACEASDRAPASFTEEAAAALVAHPWPGNIRELRNVVRRSVLLSTESRIDVQHLHFDALGATPPEGTFALSPRQTTPAPPPFDPAAGERRRIAEALEACVGNQTRAARMLGISRRTLVNRLDELGFPRPRKALAEASSKGR